MTVLPHLTRQLVAEMSLAGMGLDLLGGCYLAYDLLGGKSGPLRTIARAAGYVTLFFIGYLVVLGLQYAAVAAVGMGTLLAIELRVASMQPNQAKENRATVLLFGFLRGIVLGVAGINIAGVAFGLLFGLLCGVGLCITYAIGFAPTDDFDPGSIARVSRHKVQASLLRALAVSVAGATAAHFAPSSIHQPAHLGLKLGLAAGTVSGLVGLFSPVIESRIEQFPERQLGMLGLGLIFVGMLLQSTQYWIVVLGAAPR